MQGTKLNYNEFKEALLKIACLGKHKLYGGPQLSVDELKEQQAHQKKKQREALAGAAATGILKKKKGDGNEDELVEQDGHVQPEMLNLFEKEFDVSEMSDRTLEGLFMKLGLKPDKPLAKRSSPEKTGTTLKAQPVTYD